MKPSSRLRLVRGVKYRVQFFVGKRRIGEFVGVYLSDTEWNEAQFSLRPLAGTSKVRRDEILQALPVERDTPCKLPRLMRFRW